MQVHHVPDLGLVAYALATIYREEDGHLGLDYQRRLALWRLGHVVQDQLGLGEDEAYVIAAGLLMPLAET